MTALLFLLKAAIWIWRFDTVYKQSMNVAKGIGLGIAAEEYGSKFFQNGARPSGILTHPNTVKDPAALRASWNAAYGGSGNASRVAVLEEGVRPDRVLSKVEI